jgi:hypothetical protein
MARLRQVLVIAGICLAVALVVVMVLTALPFQPDGYGPGQDARAYWAVPMTAPYAPGSVGHESAYLYSPAFLEALAPLRLLSWPLFLGAWTTLLLLTLRWMSGPLLFGPLIVLTFPELWGGNITILLAAMIVVGFRRPGVWAFAVLTKVTPALGVLWFAVRREWPALVEVAVVTAAVVGVSLLIDPRLWREWLELLTSSTGSSTVPGSVPIPLLVRLPLAVVVIVWAALGDRKWALPIGVLFAMPVIWWGSFAILAGCVALKRAEIEARLFGIPTPQPSGTAGGSTRATAG